MSFFTFFPIADLVVVVSPKAFLRRSGVAGVRAAVRSQRSDLAPLLFSTLQTLLA